MPEQQPPSEHQIEKAIKLIKEKLSQPAITKQVNFPIKEGYELAVKVLAYEVTDQRDIAKLQTVQGRAIALLAFDFLLGEIELKVLCGVPLKG